MRRVFLIAGHNGTGTGANGFIDEGKETVILRDLIAKNLKEMGVVVYENEGMGIYFIADPDGYWTEIIPNRM